jgi:uncharacterized protein (TIGR02217 family)
MSDALYPTLDGLTFDTGNQSEFVTLQRKTLGGNVSPVSYYSTPIHHWTLTYSFLDLADYTSIIAFFSARVGALQSFIWINPTEDLVLDLIGTGDGIEDEFQINRMVEGAIITDNTALAAPLIYLDNVLQVAGYTIDAADLVTFTPAPLFSVLVWAYYTPCHRVRFAMDMMNLNEFMHQLWELNEVSLVSVR